MGVGGVGGDVLQAKSCGNNPAAAAAPAGRKPPQAALFKNPKLAAVCNINIIYSILYFIADRYTHI